MKHFKRLMAIAIALLMVLPMGLKVNAEDFDEKLTITGLTDDDVAHFYKLVEWAPDDTASVSGWKAVAPFDTVLTPAVLKDVLVGTPDDPDTPDSEYVAPTGITAELAGELARCVTTSTPKTDVTAASGKAELVVGDDDPDTDDDLGPGVYMAIITPFDADTIYNPVFVSSDFNKEEKGEWEVKEGVKTYSDEAAVKKSTGSTVKTAKTEEEVFQDGKWISTRIGETVNYEVGTTIPGYGKVYEDPHFALTDKLTYLELVTTSVKVYEKSGTTETELDASNYTLSASKSGFTVTFEADYLKGKAVPQEIVVKYDAIVTTDAPAHINVEENEVWTEFSHDPTDEDDYKYHRDTTQHYTFSIDADNLGCTSDQYGRKTSEIVKVGQNPDGSWITEEKEYSEVDPRNFYQGPLAGAEFKLYVDDKCENEYVPLDKSGNPLEPFEIVSLADGRLSTDGTNDGIKGLDAGIYYQKEKKAPAGYVKDSHVAEIVIEVEYETVEVTEYTDGSEWKTQEEYDAMSQADKDKYSESCTFETEVLKDYKITIDGKEVAHYTFSNQGRDAEIIWDEEVPTPVEIPHQFVNKKGTELPDTGGIGTTLFYVFGGIMVLGAGILLVSRQRMMN